MNRTECRWKNLCPTWLKKLFSPGKEYPLLDRAILAYCIAVVFFQFFWQISPFVTVLVRIPVLRSLQSILGILGGLLLAADVFFTRKIWQGKYVALLVVILGCAALGALRTLSYGISENLFKLCWAAISFLLLYSAVRRTEKKHLSRVLTVCYYVLLAVWVVCCLVSLYQFVNQIGYRYVVNSMSQDSSATRQGFIESRLFGIFYTLNHAAYVSLLLLGATVFMLLRQKKTWQRILLGAAGFPIVCHLILSNSRSAYISLMLSVFVATFYFFKNKAQGDTWKRWLKPLFASVLTVVLVIASFEVVKIGLTFVPKIRGDQKITYDESLLEREYLEADQSNGRLSIWLNYLSITDEIGAVGLSPGNYMPYITEHHEDLYIVSHTLIEYPDKHDSGIIIHPHNGYLMALVSSGIVGFAALICFIVLCLKKALTAFFVQRESNLWFLVSFLAVLCCAVAAMFDEGLFFQNSPYTYVFWIALGILLTECEKNKTPTTFATTETE